jgi:ubiquinone/menaquinone biosynthesis C-methylase UbiE
MNVTHANRVCPVERSGSLDSSFRSLLQNPHRILEPYVKPGDKVLDFGCGPGFFTLEIAKLTGSSGHVYAADLQQGMLDIVRNKIETAGFRDRIQLHKCDESSINLSHTVDLIFAFYMIHELPDQLMTFREFMTILRPGGKIFIIEPDFHVTRSDFDNMLIRLQSAGFRISERPKVFLSRAVILEKQIKK